MRTSLPPILIAFFLFPHIANSEPIAHVIEDPNPKTQGCQNHVSGVHDNGDVVSVLYHGQWATRDIKSRTFDLQNGGPDYSSCAIEALVRIRENGDVAWELSLDEDSREEIGIAKQDQIRTVNTFPDGRTLVTTSIRGRQYSLPSAIVMLDTEGNLLWTTKTAVAPRFSLAKTFIGSEGELFVSYNFTNFGYENGVFKLESGKKWTVRKNRDRTILAKLDPEDGELEWEKEMDLVSAKGNELLAIKTRYRKGKSKVVAKRFSYDGKRKGRFSSPWLKGYLKRVTGFNQNLALMQTVEVLEQSQRRVDHRYSELYVLNQRGKIVLQKKLSDNSIFARQLPGAPLRVVSPVKLIRDKKINRTRAMKVYTFENLQTRPKVSSMALNSGYFDYNYFDATSTPDGTWIHAHSYHGNEKSPGVSSLLNFDSERIAGKDKVNLWRPIKQKKTTRKSMGFSSL